MESLIHVFSFDNYFFVLDVNSGSVYKITELAYLFISKVFLSVNGEFEKSLNKVLNSQDNTKKFFLNLCDEALLNLDNIIEDLNLELSNFSKKDLRIIIHEIKELIKKGKFLSDRKIDEGKIIAACETSCFKSMCLNVSHCCNLRCKYCFANHGNLCGGPTLMSFEVAKKGVDFLIKESGVCKKLEIDFFGGEPLINFDVVKRTIDYAKEQGEKHNKEFRFTITTNGILLDDEKIEYINKEMSNVVLSLDGRKYVHDSMRVYPSGEGSYNTIVPNFKKLIDKRQKKNYYIRGTFTNKNLDFSNDFLEIYNLGFDKISIEPVVSDDPNYKFSDDDEKTIVEEYKILTKKILELHRQGKSAMFFHFNIDLELGPCILKRVKGCGCGREYLAVDPSGDIYPCHQFVGNTKFKFGNLFDDNLNSDNKSKFIFEKFLNKFKSFNKKKYFLDPPLIKSSHCKKCWAKYYCGGGCRANNLNLNKNLDLPYEFFCRLEKKRLECAIVINSLTKNKFLR